MIYIFAIVLREVLEAAMVISLIMGITRNINGSRKSILQGILIGIALSVCLALGMDYISSSLEGNGMEIFNAAILIMASFMIINTVLWMKDHAKKMTRQLKNVCSEVDSNNLYIITSIVSVTIAREGSEIVLFTYGALLSQHITTFHLILGTILGLCSALAIGAIMYWGIVKISPRYIFAVSSILLVLLAAGMAGHAGNFLVSAELLPEILDDHVWDTSHFVSDLSIIGRILHVTIGYSATPGGIQLLFYSGTIALFIIAYIARNRRLENKTQMVEAA